MKSWLSSQVWFKNTGKPFLPPTPSPRHVSNTARVVLFWILLFITLWCPHRIQNEAQTFQFSLWPFIFSLHIEPCLAYEPSFSVCALSLAHLSEPFWVTCVSFPVSGCFMPVPSSCSPRCLEHSFSNITNFLILKHSAHLPHFTWNFYSMFSPNSFCFHGILCKPLIYHSTVINDVSFLSALI